MDNFKLFKEDTEKLASSDIRKISKEKFIIKGFPSTKDDNWLYTRTNKIENNFFNFDYPNVDNKFNALIFKNSNFSNGIVSKNINIRAIEDLKQYESIFVNDERFINLNLSFFNKAILIEVTDCHNVSINLEIHISQNICSFPFIIFDIKNSSNITIVEDIYSDNKSFCSPFINIICNEYCSISYIKNQNAYGSFIDNTQIFIKKEAIAKVFTLSKGGELLRNNLNIYLDEEYASSEIYSAYLCNNMHIDNNVSVTHNVGKCNSLQFYKGVVKGKGRASFTGKINVASNSEGTVASQLNKSIILDNAIVNIRPQLNINTDDIKCSHGATIGNLNEDEIFYLETRGIDENTSKKIIIDSFFEEILSKLDVLNIKKFKKIIENENEI